MPGRPQNQTAGPFDLDSFMNSLEAISPQEGDECDICRREYTDPSLSSSDDEHCAHPTKLPICGHTYGRECLREWLSPSGGAGNSCPTCRAELFPAPPSEADLDLQPGDQVVMLRFQDVVNLRDEIMRAGPNYAPPSLIAMLNEVINNPEQAMGGPQTVVFSQQGGQ